MPNIPTRYQVPVLGDFDKGLKNIHLVSVVADGANGCGTKWIRISLAPSATMDCKRYSGNGWQRADPHRRSANPRQFALLACRPVRAGP